MPMYRNVVSEMSPDRNCPMTETARPKSPVTCDLTAAMIDKTSNGFNLCRH